MEPVTSIHKPVSRRMSILILGLAFLILASVLGLLIWNQQQTIDLLNKANEQLLQGQSDTSVKPTDTDTTANDDTDNNTAEDCKTKTVTNSGFPDFSFNYDDCDFTYSSKNVGSSSEYKQKEYSLKHDNSLLTINALAPAFDATPLCRTYDYKILSDGTARLNTSKEGGKLFEYVNKIYLKGSDEFNDIVDAIKDADYSNESFCYYPEIPFATDTSVISTGAGADEGDPQPGKITVSLVVDPLVNDAEFLKLADALVVGMKY